MKKLIYIFVMCFALVTLCSCAPKTASKAKDKMESKGYTVTVDNTILPAALKLATGKNIDAYVTASKKVEDKTVTVTAIYFASKDDAKDSFDSIKKYAESKNWDISNIAQSGACIYFGSEKAFKDFK